jgi:hypothetical protein
LGMGAPVGSRGWLMKDRYWRGSWASKLLS